MGRNFESFLFKNLCEACRVYKTRTMPYHPQANGLVDRSNRSLINMFRKLLSDESDWECKLPIIPHEYNTSIHKSTGLSSFEAMICREPPNFTIRQNENYSHLQSHLMNVKKTISDMC
ncbi:hypothetical protein RF11_06561 [Thelohanellus kitauei]|uniref:Integrase catalytic domain-containing protein n=1 Tax=Thelohanellus kitauei TaxID=669202 RepID=A0A0C2JW14_THEKT|nr:hypothetical protein RF11_06561 [Thelohanellus kitauei]